MLTKEFDFSKFNTSAINDPKIVIPPKQKRAKWQLEKRSIIKRPVPAWNFFLLEQQNKNQLPFRDLCMESSLKWKTMTSEEKKPYFDCFHKEEMRYQRELSFLTLHDRKCLKKCKKAKKKAQSEHPLLPRKAYIFFCQKERPVILQEFPDIKFTDVGRKLGMKWKALSSDQRMEFEKLSADDRNRYKTEVLLSRKKIKIT